MGSQVLKTKIQTNTEQYSQNREANLARLDTLATAYDAAMAGGGQKYIDRHLGRGKLLPRMRIDLLIDRDTPFLELCPLAGHRVGGGIKTGASIVGGIGVVCGVECLIVAT